MALCSLSAPIKGLKLSHQVYPNNEAFTQLSVSLAVSLEQGMHRDPMRLQPPNVWGCRKEGVKQSEHVRRQNAPSLCSVQQMMQKQGKSMVAGKKKCTGLAFCQAKLIQPVLSGLGC